MNSPIPSLPRSPGEPFSAAAGIVLFIAVRDRSIPDGLRKRSHPYGLTPDLWGTPTHNRPLALRAKRDPVIFPTENIMEKGDAKVAEK